MGGNRFPQFLPDGRRYLYFVAEARGVYLGTLDGSPRKRLFDADAAAVLVPPHEIMFVRAGTLYVQQFNADTLALGGEPIAIARGVVVDSTGAMAASASATGDVIYRIGAANRQRRLTWLDRAGTQVGEAFPADSDNPLNPAISPDGRQVAMNRVVNGNVDIWVQDLARAGAITRLTVVPTPDIYPVWSPDGQRIAYAGRGKGGFAIDIIRVSGGETSVVIDGPTADVPMDWSHDGRYLLYRVQTSRSHLWALAMDGSQKPFPVTSQSDAADERTGQLSPDGKWVAYESNESGRYEIYVQAFPKGNAKTAISTAGGIQARWSPDSKEVFYVAPDARLMAVSLRVRPDGQTVDLSAPVALFPSRVSGVTSGGSVIEYDVSKDGKRFLMNTLVEQTGTPITLVVNRAH
jgi:Tol biopolymer transport system component